MLKRSIKSCLLAFSILLAFFLVWQIWFSGYFLPDGYDYVASGLHTRIINPIVRLFSKGNDADFSHNIKMLLKPEKIVLNYSGERQIFQNGQEQFESIHVLADDFVSRILLGEYGLKTKETVDMDTYFSLLKGKSIYVDYGKSCDFRLFSSAVCGQSKNKLTDDLSVVSGYIISLHDGILNDVSLYVMDQKSQNIYRYIVEVDKNMLDSRLKEYVKASVSGAMPSYSFELNFHKEQNQSASKVLFDPLILLDLIPVSVPQVQSLGSEESNQNLLDELTDEVLKVFSINNRTMWKYTNLDHARVFVENNATLILYPNGLLEYQTVSGGRGLDIGGHADRTNYDIYAATTNAVDFVADLCSHMPPAFFDHLQLTTNLVDPTDRQETYRLSFDYYIDGTPVRHKTDDGYFATIEMEIVNGYLTSYRHFVKAYEKMEEEPWQLSPVLSAADHLVNQLYQGDRPLHINKIAPCYAADAQGLIEPAWYSLVDEAEIVIK